MKNWSDEVDEKSKIFFSTLSEKEIRRRQDLCNQQIKMAYNQKNEDALYDLQRMQKALEREMMNRL